MNTESDKFIPYTAPVLDEQQSLKAAADYFEKINQRRSLREFSDRPVAREVIENILKAANCAPSGAHKQPWTFCVISDPTLKQKIREAAEKEEYENYHGRMSEAWLKDLEAFETDWHKPFLTTVPYLIIVFKKPYDLIEGQKHKNYYVNESVGLACGFLINAIHEAGLATLTHTPSPMNFLHKILERPENEKPYLLLPVGYPADEAKVPNLHRKNLSEISIWYE
ncbi:nitroreductase family protein [Persicobacter psychrovividus]|uniref:Oxidoreductase n=1 Tax=Persicobacter psychrovividus TaxID=387638 RepID=A0ABM7VJ40_9BACT|nr:oxidoreductase [Persicobacter psychrovividus]